MTQPAPPASRPLLDRALGLLPLVLAYVVLLAIYAWQASQRATPTIFNDELELTQLSRSIAETGEAARRGQPYGLPSLYAYVIAPAWWLDDTGRAYELVKLIGAIVMTSTIFPAYALARTVLARPWALGAAIAATAIPALSYAPFLVEEPLAYPVAVLALFLIARAGARPSLGRVGAAAAAAVGAYLVRGQLSILLPVLALVLAAHVWQLERWRARRRAWSRSDWLGVAVLGIGLVLAASAFLGHQSDAWYTATGFFKQRMFDYGLRALGALVIGIGVFPLVAAIPALATRTGDPDPRVRGLVNTAWASLFVFGLYTAVKASYLSTTFGTITVERNLIYIAPLLFVGCALALARPLALARRAGWIALAAGAAVALYVVVETPYELNAYPYYDAPGLSIASLGNRNFGWDAADVTRFLVLLCAVSIAALAARSLLRGRRALALAAVLGTLLVGWNLTAEVYAARGFRAQSNQLYANLPKPVDWVDQLDGGNDALYLGAGIDDADGLHLLEFWNRSIRKVWSTDGTAPGPGLFINTDLLKPDGTLFPDPSLHWVVAENDAAVVGAKVGDARGALQLYRIDGPLRLVSDVRGLTGDGWMGAQMSFNQYAAPGTSGRGFVKVLLSRVASCSSTDFPGKATVTVGTIVVGPTRQPALGRVQAVKTGIVHQCKVLPFLIRVKVPFRVEVTITPTFSPRDVDPASSDVRQLGARPEIGFIPLP